MPTPTLHCPNLTQSLQGLSPQSLSSLLLRYMREPDKYEGELREAFQKASDNPELKRFREEYEDQVRELLKE